MPVGLTFEGFLVCLAVYAALAALGMMSERWRWGKKGEAPCGRRA